MCTAVFTISRGSEGWTLHLPVVYSKAYQRIPVYNGLEATLIQDAVHHRRTTGRAGLAGDLG